MSAGLWAMLAVARDEGVHAECGLLTVAGRRTLWKTLGGNRDDTGTQEHTACSVIAGIGSQHPMPVAPTCVTEVVGRKRDRITYTM